MKRCPECGFRADDKTCPLCGVRMKDLPSAARELKTHTHQQGGEQCVLPNQQVRKTAAPKPRQPAPRPKANFQPQPFRRKETGTGKQAAPGLVKAILVVIFVILFRACSA